jgi:dihydrofolate synthase / folylpolyglutamate synthase
MIYKTKLTKTLNRMLSLHPKLIDFDLTRLKLLMKKFKNPQNKLSNVIHIAGTNGKGSTASFLKEIFEAHNYSVNVYTSPHLINFNERIRIKKSIISDKELITILEEIESINKNKPITFFEITTAAAFIAFKRNASDINIIETGLGGRLDATNIIENKVLCIITKIGFDHTEYLGNTIDEIAGEKAGIFKKNIPAVIAKQDNPNAYKTLIASAKKIKAKLIKLEDVTSTSTLGLKGSHQYDNASSAYTAARVIIPDLCELKTLTGLRKTRWHGRIEYIKKGKITKFRDNITILDGSHNEDGALVLSKYLQEHSIGKCDLIIGMLDNRSAMDFVNIFKSNINRAFAISIPKVKSSYNPDNLTIELKKIGLNAFMSESLEKALEKTDRQRPLLITGSLYLTGHVLQYNETIIT